MPAKEQNVIHIQLTYDEALQAKRNILTSQASLLRILQTIRRYHPLRLEEISMKLKLKKNLKEIKEEISKLQLTVPKVKIPEILRKGSKPEEENEIDEAETQIAKAKVKRHDNSIEAQLQEIQSRLSSLN
jgi:hypothetical protein